MTPLYTCYIYIYYIYFHLRIKEYKEPRITYRDFDQLLKFGCIYDEARNLKRREFHNKNTVLRLFQIVI